MRLVHWSSAPLGEIRSVDNIDQNWYKPRGLWLSDEDAETSWSSWGKDSEYGNFDYSTEFELVNGHNVLIISTRDVLSDFELTWKLEKFPTFGIDWESLSYKYQGIIITPHLYSLFDDRIWYYGWDCASGCIWDVSAIKRIKVDA